MYFRNPHILFFVGILIVLAGSSCSDQESVTKTPFAFPSDFPPVAYQNPSNNANDAVFELGRKLFYDANLSKTRTVSCGSCHAQVHGFADHNIPFSFGIYGRQGVRNAPALVNLAWMSNFMWDGGIRHLDVLSIAPFTDTNEMGMTLPLVVQRANENPEYKSLLKAAYQVEEFDESKILLPLSQFMLRLVSNNSKYDRVRRGQDRYNEVEARGYQLFQNYCSNCHTEPLLTHNRFEKNGLLLSGNDVGRFRITQVPTDSFAFKVPSLRNVALTYPYMHNGSLRRLEDVLEAYNQSDRSKAPELPQFYLNTDDKKALIAFLESLTDYKFISNLELSEPR